MCGIVGTREAFFSKTKRFCSVSCSRSYSSNSKKASILARLQVRGSDLEDPSWGPGYWVRNHYLCCRGAQRAWAGRCLWLSEVINGPVFLMHPFLELNKLQINGANLHPQPLTLRVWCVLRKFSFWLCCMACWNVSSRDGTHAPCIGRRSLTTGLSGRSLPTLPGIYYFPNRCSI